MSLFNILTARSHPHFHPPNSPSLSSQQGHDQRGDLASPRSPRFGGGAAAHTHTREVTTTTTTSNIVKVVFYLLLVAMVLVLLLKETKVLEAYSVMAPCGAAENDSRIVTTNATRIHDENQTKTAITLQHSKLIESQVFHQQRNANKAVPEIINQTPYNDTTTTLQEWSSKPYNTTSFRGIDLSLPDNFHLHSNRLLYLITPTYKCKTQMVDLTRIRQTLEHVVKAGFHERLYWIVVEDADFPTQRVRQLLEDIPDGIIPFAHRAVKTNNNIDPSQPKRKRRQKHKGVDQRNLGLDTVEQVGAEGVVYFMDDDNAYHAQLFHELSYTTHVSVFAVGMAGGGAYERCHVNATTGKVDKLLSSWVVGRKFPIDMAGFAFATYNLAAVAGANANKRHDDDDGAKENNNSNIQHKKEQQQQQQKLRFSHDTPGGYLEDAFIQLMAKSVDELEPLAGNCTIILAWHVKTQIAEEFENPESSNTTFELLTGLL